MTPASASIFLLLCCCCCCCCFCLLTTKSYSPLRFHPIADSAKCRASFNVTVLLDGLETVLLLVETSREFLSPNIEFDSPVFSLQHRPCYYQGVVMNNPDSLAVVKVTAAGVISGSVSVSGVSHDIPEIRLSSQPPIVCSRSPPLPRRTCGLGGRVDRPRLSGLRRPSRSLRLDVHSNATQLERKFISLVLVGDAYFYQNRSGDAAAAENRLWEIGNFINALYKQLGINVILVKTVVWTSQPYTLATAGAAEGANSTEMLDRFMEYRMKHLGSRSHTAVHQVSGLKMTGTDVGLAHLGKLCQFALGGGVNSDLDPAAVNVAVTIAHELGHNLGMNHDEDENPCSCPDAQGCIMAAVGSEVNPLKFSTCSIRRYLEYSVDNGLGYCMSSPPDQTQTVDTRATCGNRIVEDGEECDCGLAAWCNNTCCNPNTCTFASGAKCASGTCCDTDTCDLLPRGTVCREARGSCDLPEFCNGTSEWCPEFDDHKIDGTECVTGKSHCYNGECHDRDSRCTALFNNSDFAASPASWSVGTTRGDKFGYCSYNESRLNPLEYSFTACSSANQRCGVLYCNGSNLMDLPVQKWKFMDPADMEAADIDAGGLYIQASLARLNLKFSGFRDPGLVPNGAECGSGKMCVNSECRPISEVSNIAACPNCNGKGVCAQSLLCFCDAGFAPPDCSSAGSGGSISNRPADNMSSTKTTTQTTATTGRTDATGNSNPSPLRQSQPNSKLLLHLVPLLLISLLQ